MNDAATRQDIDEVIGILREFMGQVDERFNKIEADSVEFNSKYDHLINTVDGSRPPV